MSAEPVSSLYVHVPFCAKKCSYCAFYSEASDGELVNRYVEALVRELESIAHDLSPRTIFFGGGTPSLLNLRQWEKIFDAFDRLHLRGASEWTVECNPATVSRDKAALFRERGVNRISMGVQSFDPALLERLGRIHSREMVFRSFDILRAAGFANLNLDLMFAIPGQSMETWKKTIAEAVALASEHLSCYEVIYEDDTPLFHQLQAGKIKPDEDLACDMYDALLDATAAAGFRQYEIANFAKADAANPGSELPHFACRHNVNYWRGGSYYGLGPSASAYVRGRRATNCANTTLYCERIEKGQSPADFTEQLSPLARAGELAAFGLRMVSGWPLTDFQKLTGYNLPAEWQNEIQKMTAMGYAKLDPNRFQLTPQGLRQADWIASEFLRS
jgi:oxygen-independent coproporphyrinogen-3 oxidase